MRIRLAAALTLALTLAASPAVTPTVATAAATTNVRPACCGLDGRVWNAGPTSLGIIGTWGQFPYSFVELSGHSSEERQPDVDGYYIGAGWGAAQYTQGLGMSNYYLDGYVGAGVHEIVYGYARVKVVSYRLGSAAPAGVTR